MRVFKRHPAPRDDAVYNYILKKEGEGKSKKHAKIAGLNKFLRIYYARVMSVYQGVRMWSRIVSTTPEVYDSITNHIRKQLIKEQ